MLNTFAYHAYWEERISQGFGQVDGLESKVVHGLLISPTDYREWGLSLFDATIQFLTSWQGLTFYAIVLVILLLQLTPLLAMRSKYFVPVTILLDSCCWAGYISLFARKAIQHPCDGVYPTIYIVSSAVLLMLGFRFLQYGTDTLHIYQKGWRLKSQVRPQSRVTASAEECTTVAVCVTIPFWEGGQLGFQNGIWEKILL